MSVVTINVITIIIITISIGKDQFYTSLQNFRHVEIRVTIR